MELIKGCKYNYDGIEITQEDFFISETKITVSQWKNFINETKNGSVDYLESNMKRLIDNSAIIIEDDLPVWGVTYLEIVDFCNWLSEKNNLKKCYTKKLKSSVIIVETDYEANGFRLPTLREWYYTSELWMNKTSTYYENVNILKGESFFEKECPYTIDSEKKNILGIKDPLGNIYELCNDYYLEGKNLELLKTDKYGPSTYTPDSDQEYFNEPLTPVYIYAGGTYCHTFNEVKDKFIYAINQLSSEFISFRIVQKKN